MMNNLSELFSLVHFLQIRPYCVWEKFSADFVRPFKNSSYANTRKEAMQKFQALLKAILLRRTKKSTIDGKPILTLPERETQVDHAEFSPEQQDFYEGFEKKQQLKFNKYFKAGTVGKNLTNALVLLLRLRQACCHPHLVKDLMETPSDLTPEELLRVAAECLSGEAVQRLIADANIQDCPICMDVVENATIFTPCGHSTCSECFVRISDPALVRQDDNGGNSMTFRCMTCRGTVDPKKTTDYKSFKKIHMPGEADEEDVASEGKGPESESETDSDESESESESDEEDETLGGFIVNDDDEVEDSDNEDSGNDEILGAGVGESKGKGKAKAKESVKPKKKSKAKAKSKSKMNGKGKERKEKKKKKTLSELQAESRQSAKARQRYLNRLRKTFVTSAKIEKCMELLKKIIEESPTEKIIVFSQFTTLLDLVEIPVNDQNWHYKRYDGGMSANARNDAVLEFSGKPSCRLMLVSLKAGNSGLNLTCANHVILFDPFWNPFIEEQAIDRAHRIGQRLPVNVHRLIVPGTVEDRILELQEKKRALIGQALDENASQSIARLGVQELAFLFVSFVRLYLHIVCLTGTIGSQPSSMNAFFYPSPSLYLRSRVLWSRANYYFLPHLQTYRKPRIFGH